MNGNTILLVDDSDLVVSMIREALESEGFEVKRAKDGYEAIEMTYAHIPDIIIMDVNMPLLKGYQASRLLKSRRGVQDIPIIMHTANSEDKDRFWAFNSGACAFVVKDFNNIKPLIQTVRTHISHNPPDLKSVLEDSRNIDRSSIAEALSNMLDRELYFSTIMNELANTGKSLGSLDDTVRQILQLLELASETHIACIVLSFGHEAIPYIFATDKTNSEICDDFLAVCLEDFFAHFDRSKRTVSEARLFNAEDREDWDKIKLGQELLSSYHFESLCGSGGNRIGSLHIGHTRNNYFTPSISEGITLFAREAGVIIHNSMLFNQITAMEQEIRNVFSKFVPKEVINNLVSKSTSTSILAGEKRELAILFSDIRSFTTLTEINPPEVVVSFLNHYLEIMCDEIIKHGGLVDKFIGDAILAVFGAPTSWPDNALRAVETALAMHRAMERVETDSIILPPEGLNMGIGIHYGDAIVGTIGSSTKYDYTVIGDSVNLASRLEGLSKIYNVRVIVSEQLVKAIVNSNVDHSHLCFREIEEVTVRGKEEPTRIYSVGDQFSGMLDEDERDQYKKGLSMYKLKNWKTASSYFESILNTSSDDILSRMFFERCKDFMDNPPPEDWDLVQRYNIKE